MLKYKDMLKKGLETLASVLNFHLSENLVSYVSYALH